MQSLYQSQKYVTALEPVKRNLIGNLIYDFIEKQVGEMKAPKICGMLVDLPFTDLRETVKNLQGVQAKTREAFQLLSQTSDS